MKDVKIAFVILDLYRCPFSLLSPTLQEIIRPRRSPVYVPTDSPKPKSITTDSTKETNKELLLKNVLRDIFCSGSSANCRKFEKFGLNLPPKEYFQHPLIDIKKKIFFNIVKKFYLLFYTKIYK